MNWYCFSEIGSQILEVKPDKNSGVEIPSGKEEEKKKPVDDDSTPVEDEFLREVLSHIPEENSCSSADEDSVEYKEGLSLKAAQNFMFDNSDLTQQQILAVIQYQSEKLSADQPSTSGISKLSSAASSSHHTEKKEIVDNVQSPSKAEGKDLQSPCSTEHEKKFDKLLYSSKAERTDLQSPYSREHDKIDQSLSPSKAEGIDVQFQCSTEHEKKTDQSLSPSKSEGKDLQLLCSTEHEKKTDQSQSPSKSEGKDLQSPCSTEHEKKIDQFSPSKAEGKDLQSSSKAEGKGLLSPSKAEGKDLLSPSKADGKDLLSPSKAEGEDLQTPVNLEKEGCERINGRGSEPTSDSDNEGFVEVEGIHKSLEVVIQRDKADRLEDDIFSDVFAEILSESVVNTSSDISKPEIQSAVTHEVSEKEAAPATKMSSEELQQLQVCKLNYGYHKKGRKE